MGRGARGDVHDEEREVKPRLYILFGIWHCNVKGETLTGYGYTPAEAFNEWLQVAWAVAAGKVTC